MSDLMRVIERALRPLRHRVQSLASRAWVQAVDDTPPIQNLQLEVLAGEVRAFIERVQQYGFSSVPLPGAQPVIVLCPMGDTGQMVALAVDDAANRLRGQEPGDTAIYDHRGNSVRLREGVLEITAVGTLAVNVAAGGTIMVGGAGTVNVQGAAQVTIGEALELEVGAAAEVQIGAAASLTVAGDLLATVTGNVALTAAGLVQLGGPGGPPVARVGDTVNLTTGVIETGSPKVFAL